MADFCKQCIQAVFYGEESDFAGMCKPDEMVAVLCETCGPTHVDHRGKCIGKCWGHFRQVTKQFSDLMCPQSSLKG